MDIESELQACADWLIDDGYDKRENPVQVIDRSQLAIRDLRVALARAEAERDAAILAVGKLIDSCWYRTHSGKVAWKQGIYLGISVADIDDERSYLEAIRAIRRNAGLPEDDELGPIRDGSISTLRDHIRRAEAERDAAVKERESAGREIDRVRSLLASLGTMNEARLLRERDAATERAEAAEAECGRLKQYEPTLVSMDASGAVVRAEHQVKAMAAAFADFLGPDNFVTTEVLHPDGEWAIVVTVQRKGGKTPAELIGELRADRERLKAPRPAMGREDLARVIFDASWKVGLMPTRWEDANDGGREECYGIADAVISALKGRDVPLSQNQQI